jgi:myo-inositol 2-dehydrogenase / D-chiro-inositol 1-dehydrogenase
MVNRVAILGCGAIARAAHLPSILRERDVTVVAVADQDAQNLAAARSLARDARAVAEYRDVLAMPDVDAVIIALPPALHADAAVAALEMGKHVYIEKPLATSLDDAERVVTAAHGQRLVAMMGFNYRFNPLTQQAKAKIAARAIGDIVAVRTVFSTAARPLATWKQRRESGGGALLDLAVHHIDLVRYLLDADVTSVAATLASVRSEHDSVSLQLGLTTNAGVQIFCSLSSVDEDRIDVYGTNGKLSVDRYGSLRVDVSPATARGALGLAVSRLAGEFGAMSYGAEKRRAPMHDPSFPASIGAFIKSIRDGSAASPSLTDGLRAMQVIDAAERSAATGQRTDLRR